MTSNIELIYQVIEQTWPAASYENVGPWSIRDGQGGGKRVSAATANGPVESSDIAAAEQAMTGLGQAPLFMIRDGQQALDSLLMHHGYDIVDPVSAYMVPVKDLMDERPPRTVAIPATAPLAMQREFWASVGIGPERLNVMARVTGPKVYFISRWQDKPAGSAFLGMDNGIGMVHALEIARHQQRQGLGRWVMKRAAYWVHENGGTHLSAICTSANLAANGLYASMGMQLVGQYHYRMKTDKKGISREHI